MRFELHAGNTPATSVLLDALARAGYEGTHHEDNATPVLRLQMNAQETRDLPLAFPLRLGALLDQIGHLVNRQPHDWPDSITIGPHLLRAHDSLFLKDGDTPLSLTDKERDLLVFLWRKGGKPVSRPDLLRHIWGYKTELETHTLETHIYRLRQKLEDDPAAPKILLTSDDGYALSI